MRKKNTGIPRPRMMLRVSAELYESVPVMFRLNPTLSTNNFDKITTNSKPLNYHFLLQGI
jgi:hypothetical protein